MIFLDYCNHYTIEVAVQFDPHYAYVLVISLTNPMWSLQKSEVCVWSSGAKMQWKIEKGYLSSQESFNVIANSRKGNSLSLQIKVGLNQLFVKATTTRQDSSKQEVAKPSTFTWICLFGLSIVHFTLPAWDCFCVCPRGDDII